MSKQDRQGVRTTQGLEQKYSFGKVFSRLDSENKEQNLTMTQFAEIVAETIATIQKEIKGLNASVETLTKKDTELDSNLKTMDKKLTNATDSMCKAKAGFIYPFAGGKVPEGFLLCNGSSYSRTAYPELFAAIGTTWGTGDGSTTFNVPNLAERVPVGTGGDYKLGATGGEATHKLTVNEMPVHNHGLRVNWTEPSTLNTVGVNGVPASPYAISGYLGIDRGGTTGNAGGNQSHNNMQPYSVCNYIIATGKKFVNTST